MGTKQTVTILSALAMVLSVFAINAQAEWLDSGLTQHLAGNYKYLNGCGSGSCAAQTAICTGRTSSQKGKACKYQSTNGGVKYRVSSGSTLQVRGLAKCADSAGAGNSNNIRYAKDNEWTSSFSFVWADICPFNHAIAWACQVADVH